MELGDRIKKIRKRKGLTLRELAKRSSMSHSYLSQLENRKRDRPAFEIIENIAKALDVSTLYLSAGDDDFINLSYGEGINEIIEKEEHEISKRTDDFDTKQFDEPTHKLQRAVRHEKKVTRNNRVMEEYEALFLRSAYTVLRLIDTSNFNENELIKLREIITHLFSGENNEDIEEIYNFIHRNEDF